MTGVVFSFLEQAFCVFILLQINRNAATHNSSVNVGEKLREKANGMSVIGLLFLPLSGDPGGAGRVNQHKGRRAKVCFSASIRISSVWILGSSAALHAWAILRDWPRF